MSLIIMQGRKKVKKNVFVQKFEKRGRIYWKLTKHKNVLTQNKCKIFELLRKMPPSWLRTAADGGAS